MSKKRQVILLATAGLLALVLVAVLVYELGWKGGGQKKQLPDLPGSAGPADNYDPDLLAPGLRKVLENRLLVPVKLAGGQEEKLLASSYETPSRQSEDGSLSDSYRAQDQVMYGRALARLGKRADFIAWAETFNRAFRGESDDFHAGYLKTDPETGEASPQERHWSVTLAYTRALLEAYQAFGGKAIAQLIQAESDRLLPLFSQDRTADELLAGPRTLLAYDEWDDPPEGTLPEPGEEPPVNQAVGTHLADIDLWALLALSRFDPAWAPLAANWQEILAGAGLEGSLPLYASAVGEDDKTYLAVTGDRLLSQTTEQITIALHLAEVGTLDPAFLSFIRSQLRDDKRLPAGWNPVSGGSASSYAESCDYALALSLGRACQDPVLVDSAREVLMYSYASSQTSDIFGGWYRPGGTARTYTLSAEDNTAVLVALR